MTLNIHAMTASWGAVPNAERYTLYYAPFPYAGEDTIAGIDMGRETSISAELPPGSAYYVAVVANNGAVASGYSNIELIIVPE